MAEFQVLAHDTASEVEVAVFHSQFIAAIGFVLDGEGRGDALAEDSQFRSDDLDVACRHLWVFALPFAHASCHLYAVFASEFVGFGTEITVGFLIEHQLRDAIAVAQVDEGHATHLAASLHPPCEGHSLPFVGESEFSACLSPVHYFCI